MEIGWRDVLDQDADGKKEVTGCWTKRKGQRASLEKEVEGCRRGGISTSGKEKGRPHMMLVRRLSTTKKKKGRTRAMSKRYDDRHLCKEEGGGLPYMSHCTLVTTEKKG